MHSHRGKGIFSQFKKYLLEFIEENQKRCSIVHTIVDYIKYNDKKRQKSHNQFPCLLVTSVTQLFLSI